MSENITHTAVTDDCRLLCLNSPDICEAFKECLRAHHDICRLGGVTRSGGGFMPVLLEQYSKQWANRQSSDVLEQKLAFVLGWHFHRAADLQMKGVFKAADGGCKEDPTDCSVYHDAFMFRELYACGHAEPYSPISLEAPPRSMPAVSMVDVDAVEDLFRSFWQRALIGLHTFIPDQDDINGWMERLFKTRQEFYVDIRRYAEAFCNPDPDKTKRFIHDVNFYNPADPLIALARSLKTETPDSPIALAEPIELAASQSQYAQALRKGYLYVQAGSAYFEGKIDQQTYKTALEPGQGL